MEDLKEIKENVFSVFCYISIDLRFKDIHPRSLSKKYISDCVEKIINVFGKRTLKIIYTDNLETELTKELCKYLKINYYEINKM